MSRYDNPKMCDKCMVLVSNLGRHLRRDRCQYQHIRKMRRLI